MFGLDLFKTITEGVTDYFKGKQELKKAQIAAKKIIIEAQAKEKLAISQAKIEMAKQGMMNDFDLDKIAMQNMQKSWKDEFILLLFSLPIIMSFIPSLQEYAKEGFKNLEQAPDWFLYIYIGMVVTIYGLRGLLKEFIKNKFSFFGKKK
jgi:hypothetical protein